MGFEPELYLRFGSSISSAPIAHISWASIQFIPSIFFFTILTSRINIYYCQGQELLFYLD
mgnify:CR=1 FL=1